MEVNKGKMQTKVNTEINKEGKMIIMGNKMESLMLKLWNNYKLQ